MLWAVAILAQQAYRAPPLSPSPGRRLALAPRPFTASPQGGWNLQAIEGALSVYALAAWIGLLGCLTLLPAPAAAAPLWLIATPDETARAASPIELDVVKPPGLSNWPEALTLKLMRDGRSWEMELPGVGVVAAQDARRTYRGLLPAHVFGLVRVELGGVDSNRLVLLISAREVVDQVQPMAQGSASGCSSVLTRHRYCALWRRMTRSRWIRSTPARRSPIFGKTILCSQTARSQRATWLPTAGSHSRTT